MLNQSHGFWLEWNEDKWKKFWTIVDRRWITGLKIFSYASIEISK